MRSATDDLVAVILVAATTKGILALERGQFAPSFLASLNDVKGQLSWFCSMN